MYFENYTSFVRSILNFKLRLPLQVTIAIVILLNRLADNMNSFTPAYKLLDNMVE